MVAESFAQAVSSVLCRGHPLLVLSGPQVHKKYQFVCGKSHFAESTSPGVSSGAQHTRLPLSERQTMRSNKTNKNSID